MVNYSNVYGNGNAVLVHELGSFKIIEHQRDLSVSPYSAVSEYFAAKMNLKRRQVMIELNNSGCILQAGAMQWISGNVNVSSGISGVGNFLSKAVQSKVTGETISKPEYKGTGVVMLEPTYQYILLIDVSKWGCIVLDDGMFLACDDTLTQKVVSRKNLSSAVLGGEGLFNLSLMGNGILACESPVPMDELIQVNLQNDTMKIDGNMAVAWSGSLEFTVEKSTKGLIGSAVSGEGFVNVYRGTGSILLAPTIKEGSSKPSDSNSNKGPSQAHTQGASVSGVLGGIMDILN